MWEILVENLQIFMQQSGNTPHGLAVKAGLNINAIRDILSGKSKNPRHDTLTAICNALNIGLGELYATTKAVKSYGMYDKTSGFTVESAKTIRIPEIAQMLKNNKIVPLNFWHIPRNYIEAHVHTKAETLAIVKVTGDSMIPDYRPNDRVLMDTEDRSPADGDFIIIDKLGNLQVKKIQVIATETPAKLRVISTNKKYESFELSPTEVQIKGRIIGKWDWK